MKTVYVGEGGRISVDQDTIKFGDFRITLTPKEWTVLAEAAVVRLSKRAANGSGEGSVASIERRTFSDEYKLKILDETSKATRRGEIGDILKRESLSSSTLSTWRKQLSRGDIVVSTA